MGIRSLNTIIKKYSPLAIVEKPIEFYNGRKMAIDCSILIYKYVHMSKIPNSHIVGFANRINFYLKHDILPVFVFDGVPPAAKKDVLQKRQNNRQKIQDKIETLKSKINEDLSKEEVQELQKEIDKLANQVIYVTKYHIEECKKFLEYIGIPYIQADGEAEKTCVYLKKINAVDFVVSDDTDTLTFGCESVLKTNIKGNIQEVSLSKILQDFELSYPEFVDFCILTGCDYCHYIPSIGPHTAYNLIKKYKNIESVIKLNKYKIPEDFNFDVARKLFMDYENFEIDQHKFVKKSIDEESLKQFLKSLNFKDNLISKYLQIFS